ncbi:MAG: type II toxin-antitoxin system RelE/ParE family toxin [Saprospiraceae bacterium]|nr:type II toxin-antitoxin system RelE/ParE family toxin [Saprospiraceae bacterium]MBK8826800.1 type II toxin-antitoxin system RelE/ParE family toxin [Saprospiraceae bacterium]MBK9581917.1 type II toxin-antitoxin system RelE/ParE family toxin [Saprospiraceae bacterium]
MNNVLKVIILPLAKEDLNETKVWYENKLKGLGKRFLSEVDKKINFIKINPIASNIRYDEIHTTVLDVFPFMIHYTVNTDKETIIIIAVLHTSLDPNKWQSRK